jgi:hypothetical protein
MGKGEIISAEGAGAYRLKILHDRERAEAQITKLQEEITALGASIANKDTEIATAEDEAEYLAQVLDAKIHALGQEEEPTAATEQAVKDATKDHAEAVRLVASLRQAQAYMRLRAVACEKRIGWIEDNIPADETVAAWCADYNEELTGNVGTVEVGREGGTLHVIVPGGADGSKADYDAARDGQLQSPASSTPSAAFVNYALLPGTAKWLPRYRTGTITALNGDTCSVSINAASSTHQELNINQAGSLAAVPIEYMTCNGAAFEVGDDVIVEFTGMDWTAPKVVGFVDHPKTCIRLSGPESVCFWSQFTAEGGIEPYIFSVESDLVTIDPQTGQITEIDGGEGDVGKPCKVRVTDVNGAVDEMDCVIGSGRWVYDHAEYYVANTDSLMWFGRGGKQVSADGKTSASKIYGMDKWFTKDGDDLIRYVSQETFDYVSTSSPDFKCGFGEGVGYPLCPLYNVFWEPGAPINNYCEDWPDPGDDIDTYACVTASFYRWVWCSAW